MQVNIPYASKLLIQELLSMCITTRLMPELSYQMLDRNLMPSPISNLPNNQESENNNAEEENDEINEVIIEEDEGEQEDA